MPSWFITFCKSVDFAAYTSMLVPVYLAYKRRSSLTGGLVMLRWLPAFLFTMYLLMNIANILWHNNLPLLHLNTVGEALIYLKIYYDEFTDAGIRKRIRIVGLFFIVFAIIDSFFLEGFKGINSYTNLLESVIVIALILLLFEKMITKNRYTSAKKAPIFVASIGIVIYLSGTILLYLTTNYFINLNDEYILRLMYLLGSVLLLLLSVLLSRAFLLVKSGKTVAS